MGMGRDAGCSSWARWALCLGRTHHKCPNTIRNAVRSHLLDLIRLFIPSENYATGKIAARHKFDT